MVEKMLLNSKKSYLRMYSEFGFKIHVYYVNRFSNYITEIKFVWVWFVTDKEESALIILSLHNTT